MADDDGLQDLGRFEWERIIRRCKLPTTTKAVALMFATYANGDGSSIRPGETRLALALGVQPRNVRRHLAELRRLGLIKRVKRGHGEGRGYIGKAFADAYKLTMPDDLMDRVEIIPDPQLERETTGT